jgi:hypothetical protein
MLRLTRVIGLACIALVVLASRVAAQDVRAAVEHAIVFEVGAEGDWPKAEGLRTGGTWRMGRLGRWERRRRCSTDVVMRPAGNVYRNYDIAADGQRFLMVKAAGSDATHAPQIVVVQHFDEELKRLVPVK